MYTLNPVKGRKVFYISDTHFNHERVLRLSNRPFNSVKDHDEEIIKNWNNLVSEEDYVVFAGDFCMVSPGESKTPHIRALTALSYLQRLQGRIFWTLGNHDKIDVPYLTKKLGNQVKIMGCPIMVSNQKEHYPDTFIAHYPYESWVGSCGEVVHLHGHVHGALDAVNRRRYTINDQGVTNPFYRYDVGVDSNNFTPVTIDQIYGDITNRCSFSEFVLWV
jgi:calcineurin-like phosphoesterase family protein